MYVRSSGTYVLLFVCLGEQLLLRNIRTLAAPAQMALAGHLTKRTECAVLTMNTP